MKTENGFYCAGNVSAKKVIKTCLYYFKICLYFFLLKLISTNFAPNHNILNAVIRNVEGK